MCSRLRLIVLDAVQALGSLEAPKIESVPVRSSSVVSDSLWVGSLSLVPPAVPCLVLCLVAQSCSTFCSPTDCSQPGSSVHGDSPGKHTGLGCHSLLQGIFPTQRSNLGGWIEPRSPAFQANSLPSEHQGSP